MLAPFFFLVDMSSLLDSATSLDISFESSVLTYFSLTYLACNINSFSRYFCICSIIISFLFISSFNSSRVLIIVASRYPTPSIYEHSLSSESLLSKIHHMIPDVLHFLYFTFHFDYVHVLDAEIHLCRGLVACPRVL